MKKANTNIDFMNDKINFPGQEIDIRFTPSGHHSVPISKCYEALRKNIITVFYYKLTI